MGFYPGNFPVQVDLAAGMKLAGTAVTSSAAELNLSDQGYQLLVADGAITVKNGICVIAKTVRARWRQRWPTRPQRLTTSSG